MAMLEQVGKFPPRGSGGGGVRKLEEVKGGMSESLDPMANSSDQGALPTPILFHAPARLQTLTLRGCAQS